MIVNYLENPFNVKIELTPVESMLAEVKFVMDDSVFEAYCEIKEGTWLLG